MKRRINKSLKIVVSLLFFLWLFPHWMYSCGPYFPHAVFTYKYHPDFPLENYAAGTIGIPQPVYARSYLVIAYRYFSGVPLNAGEQSAAVRLWNHRIADRAGYDSKPKAVQEWLDARRLVPGVQQQDEVKNGRRLPDYNSYLNCYDDAFHAAATTLKARIKLYGASDPDVRDWLNAQDIVFAYCGEPSVSDQWQNMRHGVTAVPLPTVKPAPVRAAAWLRADRAYQTAAMNFYGGSFDAARQQFEKIAADPLAPWSKLAPYLAARAVIRKATLMTAPNQNVDPARLTEAETRLNTILKDPRLKAIHEKARTLRGFVEFRLHPLQAGHELARGLLRASSAAVLREELEDYTQLLDKFLGSLWEGNEQYQHEDFGAYAGKIRELRRDPLTDWILTFQFSTPNEHRHAVVRWQATHSLPWLIAALTHATAADPHLPELLQAASQVTTDSPGYPAVQFHRLRLLADSGQMAQVSKDMDVILNTDLEMPTSARNEFLTLRMRAASSATEMLQYSLRPPVGVSDGDNFGEVSLGYEDEHKTPSEFAGLDKYTPKIMFDRDFGSVWSRALPLSLSTTFVTDASLPENLQKQLALAAFTRAVVLKNDALGRNVAVQLASLFPETEPYVQEYRAAEAENTHFAGIFTILHFPGMKPVLVTGLGRSEHIRRIDDYRDNWWCPLSDGIDLNEPAYLHEYRVVDHSSAAKPVYPLFLTTEEKSQAADEWKAVQAASPSANYLGREVLAWAQSHPHDPRVPEALHLAVRAARYGCNDKQTARFARACFRYLHQHYADSQWAKKTPIWSE